MDKKIKHLGILGLMIMTLSIGACSQKDDTDNTDLIEGETIHLMEQIESNSEIETMVSETEKEDNSTSQQEARSKTTSNEPVPVKQKEVNIYSMDEATLSVVSAVAMVSENTILTPEIIVDMVTESFADRLVTIKIDSVTTENDIVIVSFQKEGNALFSSGSTIEGTILDALAQSLVDNLRDYPKVIFRAEGKEYQSGHFEFGLNDVYLDNTVK